MSKEAKVKRLKAVLNTFSRNRVTFYMSKEMLANLKEFDLPVQLSPSYAELMRMPWPALPGILPLWINITCLLISYLKLRRFFLNRMMPIKLSMRRIILIPGV